MTTMESMIGKVTRKAVRCAARVLYPLLRFSAIRAPVAVCDASGLAELELAFRPPYVAAPVPNRSAWPDVPEVDISFVVPCYNVESYVAECLNSIIAQETSHAFEVIAIDDGSSDATGGILDDLAVKDARIRVIHQDNRGFSGARNAGLDNVRGGVIVFVDSDDAIAPDAIGQLLAPLDDPSVGFSSGCFVTMSEDGRVNNNAQSVAMSGFPWGHAFRREVWRDIEFPVGYWFEDSVIKYCVFGLWKEAETDAVVYRYRANRGGITHTSKLSKKSLDTVWVVQQMISWRRALGGPFDQRLFDQTLRQFGPLAHDRLQALSDAEMRSAFALMCDTLGSVPEFEGMETAMQGRWSDVLLALRTRNYKLWSLACYFG